MKDISQAQFGYQNQWELTAELCTLLDSRLYFLYNHHQWLGPDGTLKHMMGLVVTREEFERNLARASRQGLLHQMDAEERQELENAEQEVALRLQMTDSEHVPLLQLWERLELDSFEFSCVMLAYAGALDEKYEKLFGYLQDDVTKKLPSVRLAAQLYLPEDGILEEYAGRFSGKSTFTRLFEAQRLKEGYLALSPEILMYLNTGALGTQFGYTVYSADEQLEEPLMIRKDLARRLDAFWWQAKRGALVLWGGAGIGKRTQIHHLCRRNHVSCLLADMSLLPRTADTVSRAQLVAKLMGSCLCLSHMEGRDESGGVVTTEPVLTEAVEEAMQSSVVMLLSEAPIHLTAPVLLLEEHMEETTLHERTILFQQYLPEGFQWEGTTAEELASKFCFMPLQIRMACRQAAELAALEQKRSISPEQIHESCYRQVVTRLDELASRVRPAYTWADVVLPEDRKRIMRHACDHIRFQHQIYDSWGFSGKVSYGRGLSILFGGPPGTGKTMCAQVIAKQLNMELYKINLSQIVSKYIGETEKNLQMIFHEAKRANCILFFDECDALFGKRSDVKDAHDRNANVEVAYLLQQMEEHTGVCIMATNLVQNIDAAFMRRITYVVHFPFPDAVARGEIYRRMLPECAPVEDNIDWTFLAECFEISGGHIKNIVLSAAFMAAAENSAIGMRHLLRAAVDEMKKNEIVVVREALREYADLLDSGMEAGL